ncbi:thiol:disulfide interchange protein [Yeosuana aromativorans]|uniref:Thiol:disulfide interchange protein n=2 Tax=Yeosuana aromativorans TaxID=288019 RepID=A0A8J3FGR2_9FLAO|nr:thiol:disulfide interchange protein [Yeosuana aromativorans]
MLMLHCVPSTESKNEFTISGSVKGASTKQLILYYKNKENKSIADTIPINNGNFKFIGYLNNPQKVALTGNVKERIYDNQNIARFYIGEDKVSLHLIEDEFNKVKVTGSDIQDEYIKYLKQTESLYKRIYPIMLEKKSLMNQVYNGDDNAIIENQLNDLNNKHFTLLDSIRTKNLRYAWNHPDSYLAADVILFYNTALSKDSLKKYYTNLSEPVKTSFQAEAIKKIFSLNNNIAEVGEKAPNFYTKTSNGKEISLTQFKGKYVLLDFWAGWCIPCLKKHSELKELYKTYHPKGLEIIGVSFDKDKKSWQDNIKKEEVNWYNVFVGLDNIKKDDAISKKYNIQPIPAYILIDKDGTIIGRYLNADKDSKDMEDLEKSLKKLLK